MSITNAHTVSGAGRTIRASSDIRPVRVSASEIKEAWKRLQREKPEKYGPLTRNPRWRLNPV